MMNRERKVNPMSDCIFCKLAGGEIPTNMIYQNELVACFADANPQAPVHVLVVPKCHIESADGVNASNSDAVKAVFEAIPLIAEKLVSKITTASSTTAVRVWASRSGTCTFIC